MLSKEIVHNVITEYEGRENFPKGNLRLKPDTPIVDLVKESLPDQEIETSVPSEMGEAILKANKDSRQQQCETYTKELGKVIGGHAERAFKVVMPLIIKAVQVHKQRLEEVDKSGLIPNGNNLEIEELIRPAILELAIIDEYVEQASEEEFPEKNGLRKPGEIVRAMEVDLFNDILSTKVNYVDEAIVKSLLFPAINCDQRLVFSSLVTDGVMTELYNSSPAERQTYSEAVLDMLDGIYARPAIDDGIIDGVGCYIKAILSLLFYRGLKDLPVEDGSVKNDFINQSYNGTRYWGNVIHKLNNQYKRDIKKGLLYVPGYHNNTSDDWKRVAVYSNKPVKFLVYAESMKNLFENNLNTVRETAFGGVISGKSKEGVTVEWLLENKQYLKNAYDVFSASVSNQNEQVARSMVTGIIYDTLTMIYKHIDSENIDINHNQVNQTHEVESYITKATASNTDVREMYANIIAGMYDKGTMSHELIMPTINGLYVSNIDDKCKFEEGDVARSITSLALRLITEQITVV